MQASNYELVIENDDVDSPFSLRAMLYYHAERIGTTYCHTSWGAKRWARKVARRHKRQQPYHQNIRFNV